MNFYTRTLTSSLQAGHLQRTDRILIVGGGEYDRRTFADLGFENVLITNLAPHAGQGEYAPYPWQREDAEALGFPDNHFDWAVEHAALHHLGSPHRGLLEMLRVARKGVIAFEARDSALMRLAVRLGLTSDYELEPAFLSGGKGFGFRDTPIPTSPAGPRQRCARRCTGHSRHTNTASPFSTACRFRYSAFAWRARRCCDSLV